MNLCAVIEWIINDCQIVCMSQWQTQTCQVSSFFSYLNLFFLLFQIIFVFQSPLNPSGEITESKYLFKHFKLFFSIFCHFQTVSINLTQMFWLLVLKFRPSSKSTHAHLRVRSSLTVDLTKKYHLHEINIKSSSFCKATSGLSKTCAQGSILILYSLILLQFLFYPKS